MPDSRSELWVHLYILQLAKNSRKVGASSGASNQISANNVIDAALMQSEGSSGAINNQINMDEKEAHQSYNNNKTVLPQIESAISGAAPAGSSSGTSTKTTDTYGGKKSSGGNKEAKNSPTGTNTNPATSTTGTTTPTSTDTPKQTTTTYGGTSSHGNVNPHIIPI